MKVAQLTLIEPAGPQRLLEKPPRQRVFEHWAYMTGRHLARCKMGPKRAKLIDDWLRIYDEETLLLACEGMAASPWHAGDNPHGRPCDDIELMLRDEAHIERFVADGERVRELAADERREAHAAAASSVAPVEDPAKTEATRARFKEWAARLSGRRRG